MIIALTAGCGRSGVEIADPDGLGRPQPLPNFPGETDDPTGTPSPTGTPPVLPDDAGNGTTGPLDVTAPFVPNVCTSLLSGQDDQLDVASTIGFTAGTRALVMQVQDSFVTTLFDPGPVSVLGSAGRWEIVHVASTSGGITLAEPLYWRYETTTGSRAAQACILPQYTNVTVSGAGVLAAAPWNGVTGGVVAFFAETLAVASAVSADAAGFRGGVQRGDSSSADITAETTTGPDGAGKGEGLDPRSYAISGRGNWANAAGGGNASAGGGGGGGNAGAGGLGGKQRTGEGDIPATAGRPGAAVSASLLDRLVLGGGGGGGHEAFNATFPGGRGGGAVILFVGSLSGNGAIRSNGASVPQTAFSGAGGGGAGGSILVRAATSNFVGSVRAIGGNGGNVDNGTMNTPRGAGGGGGGGRIRLIGVTPSTTDALGGTNGTNVNSNAGVTPNGALPGSTGVIE